MSEVKIKSYIKYYWIAWIFITALRFIFKEKEVGLILILWIPIMIINILEQFRLSNYVKKFNKEKYRELYNNYSFASFKFLFSEDDLGDPNVKLLKSNYKRFLLFVIIVFISFPMVGTLLWFI